MHEIHSTYFHNVYHRLRNHGYIDIDTTLFDWHIQLYDDTWRVPGHTRPYLTNTRTRLWRHTVLLVAIYHQIECIRFPRSNNYVPSVSSLSNIAACMLDTESKTLGTRLKGIALRSLFHIPREIWLTSTEFSAPRESVVTSTRFVFSCRRRSDAFGVDITFDSLTWTIVCTRKIHYLWRIYTSIFVSNSR
jgi:hypothetical protein